MASDPAALRREEIDWRTLMDAAQHMRDNHRQEHPRYVFWTELATWLEVIAAKERGRVAVGSLDSVCYLSVALTLARDYLRSVEA